MARRQPTAEPLRLPTGPDHPGRSGLVWSGLVECVSCHAWLCAHAAVRNVGQMRSSAAPPFPQPRFTRPRRRPDYASQRRQVHGRMAQRRHARCAPQPAAVADWRGREGVAKRSPSAPPLLSSGKGKYISPKYKFLYDGDFQEGLRDGYGVLRSVLGARRAPPCLPRALAASGPARFLSRTTPTPLPLPLQRQRPLGRVPETVCRRVGARHAARPRHHVLRRRPGRALRGRVV